MSCEDIKQILPLYLNNELDHHQSTSIRKHLDSCEECPSELYDLQGVDSLFKTHINPLVAPEFNYHRVKSKKRAYYISSIAAAVLFFYIIFSTIQRDTTDLKWENNNISEIVELNDDVDIIYSDYRVSNSMAGYSSSEINSAFYSISEDTDYLQELGN